MFCVTGTAAASDVVENTHHKHVLKTSRSAQCDTPSGKLSKQCAQSQNTPSTRVRTF